MWEDLDSLVDVIQRKLVFTNFTLMADRTITPEFSILGFLQKPTRFAVLEIGGEVGDL